MFKLENESPRAPPEKTEVWEIPKAVPLVPELTLYSPATTSEMQKTQPGNQKNNNSNLVFGNLKKTTGESNKFMQAPAPTVTDLSILSQEPVQKNPILRKSGNQNFKENFQEIPKPMVPEVSIFEKKSNPEPAKKKNVVFDEDYKKLLSEAHDNFMKQVKDDKKLLEPQTQQQSSATGARTIFNPRPVYVENPLAKYYKPAPQPKQVKQLSIAESETAADSSSILDVDTILKARESKSTAQAQQVLNLNQQSDEETFKKVAEMLNEMQRLVGVSNEKPAVPATAEPDTTSGNRTPVTETDDEILWRLANKYLTKEELQFYKCESELKMSGSKLKR